MVGSHSFTCSVGNTHGFVPGTVLDSAGDAATLRAVHELTYLIFTRALWDKDYYQYYSIVPRGTEAQRS